MNDVMQGRLEAVRQQGRPNTHYLLTTYRMSENRPALILIQSTTQPEEETNGEQWSEWQCGQGIKATQKSLIAALKNNEF